MFGGIEHAPPPTHKTMTQTMKADFRYLSSATALLLLCHSTYAQTELAITKTGNQVEFSWPNSLTFYDLQWSPDLASGSWNITSHNIVWAGHLYYGTDPIVSGSRFFRLASRDPFTNTFSQLFEYDDNIKDGVAIQTNIHPFTVAWQGATNFVIAFPGPGIDVPVQISGDTLRNQIGPIEFSTFYMLDVLLLSDGVNKVFTFVGQEKDDPLDLAFNLTCWTEAKGSLAASDLAGTWKFHGYSNPHLRDTSGPRFSPMQITVTITAIGPNKISISGLSGTATILGMEATFDNVPLNTGASICHTLKIVSNGLGIGMYSVATETNDPTDVSVMVLLGTKQVP